MMTRMFAMTVAVCLCFASSLFAHDPVEIAQRCTQRVTQIVERCDNAAADETRECVRRINALLDAGRSEAAEAVAEECVRSATQRARNCSAAIEAICDECVDILLTLGEPQLARRVNNVCEGAVEHLRISLQRQKNIIRQALAG